MNETYILMGTMCMTFLFWGVSHWYNPQRYVLYHNTHQSVPSIIERDDFLAGCLSLYSDEVAELSERDCVAFYCVKRSLFGFSYHYVGSVWLDFVDA